MNGEERVGARKVGKLAAEGANVTVGYWQTPQESERVSLDGEIYQATEKSVSNSELRTSLLLTPCPFTPAPCAFLPSGDPSGMALHWSI